MTTTRFPSLIRRGLRGGLQAYPKSKIQDSKFNPLLPNSGIAWWLITQNPKFNRLLPRSGTAWWSLIQNPRRNGLFVIMLTLLASGVNPDIRDHEVRHAGPSSIRDVGCTRRRSSLQAHRRSRHAHLPVHHVCSRGF